MDRIEIGMGNLAVAEAPTVLSTSSIGSCIAICLWSQADKKGGLAHIMLPRKLDDGAITEEDFRYGDIALQVMVAQLEKKGVPKSQLIAKIVGAANMFPDIQARSPRVGEKNLESIKHSLEELNIPIAAAETGGNVGRSICFDLGNGIVTINMTI